MKKGIIKGLSLNKLSGLQTLIFEDDSKVFIENYGLRVMDSAFGDESPAGKEIEYETDESNIMTSFNIL